MEDTRISLMAVGALLVALAIIIGSAVLAPSFLVVLATLGAWANLTYLVAVTLLR
ncbi:sugar tyrosine-protein kinase [Azospirillum agricola]|uniref:sugar tyrosine-protein kinase n=1 Tax=Azospirillum agricola TaxID=1720247 RepID=UPI000A0EEC96|nr:sugar tyrosine-protein kinase [Azospirillum agricola]SMH58519.1 hypothetical protein SAMN02982994_4655 [Azospirillum lipoferum]